MDSCLIEDRREDAITDYSEAAALAGDLGLCDGACGGDLLFAEACLDHGMRVEGLLARAENEFVAESVTFADPDRSWEQSYTRVKENPAATVLVMPEELSRWHWRPMIAVTAGSSSRGLCEVSFTRCGMARRATARGTESMVELVRKADRTAPDCHRPGGFMTCERD